MSKVTDKNIADRVAEALTEHEALTAERDALREELEALRNPPNQRGDK